MINVEFYNFAKKKNSTEQPVRSSATIKSCVLKESCGIVNPRIILDYGTSNNPTFNYMFIPKFGRYYFINEWTYNKGLWECNASVDVLASFKASIGNSTQYILRCSDPDYYDEDIIDSIYTTKGGTTIIERIASGSFYDGSNYVVGVYGNDGNSIAVGPITFYVLTEAQMKGFTEYLFGALYDVAEGSEVVGDVLKYQFDPQKYIASAKYMPIGAPPSGTGLPVIFGWYEGNVTASRLSAPMAGPFTTTIQIPKHPQASTRGNYLNLAPYTSYTLYTGPFGVIDLNPSDLYDLTSLTLEVTEMDYTTGIARFQVKTGLKTIAERIVDISVDVPLAQISRSLLGSVTHAVTKASPIANLLAQGVVDITTMALNANGIGINASPLTPQFETFGNIGSRSALYTPFISGRFVEIIDENLDHQGKPCCKEETISNLNGYIVCADGELEVACTGPEHEELSNYLTSGFFYE